MALPGNGSSPFGAAALAAASQAIARSTQNFRAATMGTASKVKPIHRSAKGQRRHARANQTTARWQREEQAVHPREPSGVGAPGWPQPPSQVVEVLTMLVMRGRHAPHTTDQRPIEHQPEPTSAPVHPQSSQLNVLLPS
jgi:hypothetical protein